MVSGMVSSVGLNWLFEGVLGSTPVAVLGLQGPELKVLDYVASRPDGAQYSACRGTQRGAGSVLLHG